MIKNKIVAAAGLCGIILGLGIFQPAAAELYVQSDTIVQIHQQPYSQSAIVGYIRDNNVAELQDKGRQGWIKIKSGDVIGWVDKNYFTEQQPDGYTVAKIHPDELPVYIDPDKNSTVYTTVYGNQEIECVNYENDWLTLAFDDGSYGFIDAYDAELNTYYGTATPVQETVDVDDSYDLLNQTAPPSNVTVEDGEIYYNDDYNDDYQEYYEQPVYEDPIYEQPIYQEPTYEQPYYQEPYQEEPPVEEYYEQEPYYEEPYEEEPYYEEPYEDPGYYQEEPYEQEPYEQQPYYEEPYEEEPYQEPYEQPYEQEPYQEPSYGNTPHYDIVAYADQFLGNPYVYGGNSLTDGIDCSHFVWQVLTNTGYYSGGYAVADCWAYLGTGVNSLDEAVAGDVIVYPGHVAIYDGYGCIVEAKGSAYGITHDRSATYTTIVAIRHFGS